MSVYFLSKALQMALVGQQYLLLARKYMKDGITMIIQQAIYYTDTIDSTEQQLQHVL